MKCFKTKDECEIGDSDCGEHNDSDSEIEIDFKASQVLMLIEYIQVNAELLMNRKSVITQVTI